MDFVLESKTVSNIWNDKTYMNECSIAMAGHLCSFKDNAVIFGRFCLTSQIGVLSE